MDEMHRLYVMVCLCPAGFSHHMQHLEKQMLGNMIKILNLVFLMSKT